MATVTQADYRVSPSKLGALCEPSACLRCCWMLLRLKFKTPYNFPMPGIMFGMDAQQKQIAQVSLEKNGQLPDYFGPFAEATELLDITSISGYHSGTKLALYGKPDLVLRTADDLVFVIDNKTAAPKPADHPLTLKYIVQTNFYGFLLQHCPEAYDIGRVGILYYTFDALSDKEILRYTNDDHVWSRLKPSIQEVKFDPEKIVVPVLRQIRNLLDDDEIPEGKEDCKDCLLLEDFWDLIRLNDSMMPDYLSKKERQEWQAIARYRDLKQIEPARQRQLDSLPAAGVPGGVLSSWFDDDNIL